MKAFIQKYNLRPGDRIVTPRSGWRLIQHHAIYWGVDHKGVHWIIENQDNIGVQIIELQRFVDRVFEVKRIEYFKGNDNQRRAALTRGEELLGTKYDLFKFNCEHFANYLQHGKSYSTQVENFSGGLRIAASLTLFFMVIGTLSKN